MVDKKTVDRKEIHELLNSPYFLKIADSVLGALDRRTLAEIIAAYLYFRSRGRSESEFASFVLSEKFPEMFFLALRVGIPVVLPGLFLDKRFRTLIVSVAKRSV
jgi:hypothetical protein